ncbi:MAG: GIY-YIG nuclease family protein [Rhodospirillales bacterium]|nr:GIY-YIG nuclease family protein [Rhodospirillales bacterium]
MVYIFLILLASVLGTATFVLLVIVWESYSESAGVIIRKWRIALSKRRQINDALRNARLARQGHQRAYERQQSAERQAKRAEDKARESVARMGSFIIAEQSGEHIKAIKANNYHAKEKKVLRSIEVAAQNGYHLPNNEREQLSRMLKQAHENAIRYERERQRQAEIKAQIREEERAEKERQRAIREAEKERKLKQKALEEALRLLGDTHSEEIEKLKAELAEAEAKANRALSMAQQTKTGHIYVISNIGSFGKDVYKVGMTRRLDPMDRVKELGDASVPFSFDVHAMISAEDAPKLEAELHQDLETYRMNRVNYRKEFFRVDLETIINRVRQRHGEIEYQADPEALEYFETLAMLEDNTPVEHLIDQEADSEEVSVENGKMSVG